MKESSQPKALNILRSNQTISSAKSTTSSTSNVIANRKPRVTTYISTNNDKPSINIFYPSQKTSSKTGYNGKLKTKKSSSSINNSIVSNSSSIHSQHYPYTSTVPSNSHYLSNNSNVQKERPTIEIYKPGAAQLQRPSYSKPSSMTKSYTAPVINSIPNTFNNNSNNNNNNSNNNSSSNSSVNINSNNNNISNNINSNNSKTNSNTSSKHYTTTTTLPHQLYRNINNNNSYNNSALYNNNPQLYHITTNSNNYSSISVDHQTAITSPTKISISQSSSTSTLSSESSQKSYLKQQKTSNEIGYGSTEDENQEDDDNNSQSSHEENILNEARVNRKIADLEISNQSLLAVNEMLEATVRKQASEMAKLKKRIQFGNSEGSNEGTNVLLNSDELIQPLPNSDLSEDEWENDKSFQKLCRMTDNLIEQAQLAIKFEYKGAGRVISVYNNDDGNEEIDTGKYTINDKHG